MSPFRTLRSIASIALLLAPFTLLRAVEPAASSPFYKQVAEHFAAWDRDHDDALSINEIETAVHDPAVTGEAAAAAAALRRAVRADKDVAPVTKAGLLERLTTPSTKERPQPKFEAHYAAALERIRSTKRELFVDDAPRLETISQGRMGDCFLLASLGTCAERDPARLKRMLRPAGDGKASIAYGDGKTRELNLPTDAELVIGATTRNTGVWAGMYELAVGTVMLERAKSDRHATPFSLIGVGGSPHVPLEILTGHKVRRHGCELYRAKMNEHGGSADDLDPLRKDLLAAFADRRLIVGGCGPIGKQAIVKGIYYNHSYGVLDYDEKTDTVLFWNPFGNTFTPKGEPGLKNGYPTKNGKFRVPLNEAVMWFGSFSLETDEASEK
ncbi:MAG: hypothetical protein QM811_04490 [Pirellulales bacterium]